MIKLIAIDLDGTLLTEDKQISPANKAALAKAKAAGVKVVLCTGRPLRAIDPFLKELHLLEAGDYSITFNGGLVQKNDTEEIMEKAALTTENVQELYKLAQQLALPLDVVSDGTVLQLPSAPQHKSWYDVLNKLLHFEPSSIKEIDGSMIYNKAVVAYEQEFLDQQIAQIPASYYEKYEIIKTRSTLLEFMPKGVTKAYGIALLAKDLGIQADEIMGIGDEENDLPMIEYAGIGVAMDNAVPMVKAAADYITASNHEDGVALAVEKFVLQPLVQQG